MNVLSVAGPGSKYQSPHTMLAGFWAGVWHGLICPFTFIVGLFSPNVRIYEVRNNGRWYDFGFIIGVSLAFGGGGSSAHQSSQNT